MPSYQSRYGATRPLSFAQYVAEVVCTRQAALSGRVLPQRFWELPDQARLFKFQVMLCNTLLARFPPGVISAVLRSPDGQSVCTLRNPRLAPMLEAEAERQRRRRDHAARPVEEEPPRDGTGLPPARERPPVSRPGNLFGTL